MFSEEAGQLQGADASSASPAPSRGALLIDFDNLLPPADGTEISLAKHRLMRCIASVLRISPQLSFLTVRLYGGWRADGLLSRRGSEVAAILPGLDPFPMRLSATTILRGSVGLATGLVGIPGQVLEDTYRRRATVPRLRLSSNPLPEGCAGDAQVCPARILKHFTSGGRKVCPAEDCSVLSEGTFVAGEQKMVDTLLTCDLLEFAADSQFINITVTSADTDFVPPLILAKRRSAAKVQLVVPMRGWSPANTTLLEQHGVLVTEMEEFSGAE